MDKKLSLLGVIRPIYLVLSSFGLFPYSLKIPKNGGIVIIRKSIYFNSISGVFVIILIYSFYVLHVQNMFATAEGNTMTEAFMTKLNYMLEITNWVVFCSVAYVSAFRNGFIYPKMLSAIAASCNNFPDQTKNKILKDILGRVRLVMYFLCMFLVMQLTVNFTRPDSVWKMVLVALTFVFPQMIQLAVIAFYCILLFALSAILNNIDKKIADVAKMKTVLSSWLKLEMKPYSLRQLKVAYVKVVEVKREINGAFQACLLVTTFQCFHSMISEAQILYDGIASSRNFPTHNICNCSIWIMYQVLKIYAISYSGTLMKKEEAKISRSLYNIPAGQQNMTLFLEIQHFSTLMSHQTTDLTVYGYFVLDLGLMFNMIATVILYLTIVVQFDEKI